MDSNKEVMDKLSKRYGFEEFSKSVDFSAKAMKMAGSKIGNRFVKKSFLGKISGFSSKEERDFESAHLDAYKKGKTIFYFNGETHIVFIKYDLINGQHR